MRDLRLDIRMLSEPVAITIYDEIIVDGIPVNDNMKSYDAYANVFTKRDKGSNGTTGSDINANSVIVQLRRNTDYKITPEQTRIVVRGKEYIVKYSDEFGINQEYINVTCVVRND